MTCTYVGELRPAGLDTDGPVAVYACHACPGGVLVLNPHDHQHAHPSAPASPDEGVRVPTPRDPADLTVAAAVLNSRKNRTP